MHACTIAAVNYLAKTMVLAHSFLDAHPASRCTLLLVADSVPPWIPDTERLDILCPGDIGYAEAELHHQALLYDVTELATALKPALLLHLLRDHDRVVYLDPDMQVLRSLEAVEAAFERAPIVLTPHFRRPPTHAGAGSPTEYTMLEVGTFNLGFVGVSSDAEPFLSWWRDRLAIDCVVSPREQLFVDQRWVNLAVGYWDVSVVRDLGINLAYWNIDEGAFEQRSDGLFCGGRPVALFHFSGLPAPGDRRWTTHVPDSQRQPCGEVGAVRSLFSSYTRAVAHNATRLDLGRRSEAVYPFSRTATGDQLTSSERRFARATTKAGGAGQIPDPFRIETAEAFRRWMVRQRMNRIRVGAKGIAQGMHTSFPGIESAAERVLGARLKARLRSSARN